MKKPVAWGRIAFILLGMVPGGLLFTFGPLPDQESNSAALRILATVLAILTGFLIAIITILGDPRALYPGSWRVASAHRRQISRALYRFTFLFYAYLVTILAVFSAALLVGYAPCSVQRLVTHVALCFGVTALCWSFGLPWSIQQAQMSRLDAEIAGRREKSAGPRDD